MVVALIALTGLVALGTLTVLSVQGGLAASGHDRHKTTALYAAESGAAAAMVALKQNFKSTNGWTDYIKPNPDPLSIPGDRARPGQAGNLFAPDTRAWYEIQLENNRDDPRFADGIDSDKRVIIRATGHGPDGALAQIEWQVGASTTRGQRPCPGYGQKGMAEDGAGRNDCLGTIVATDSATYSPGGP